MKRFFLTSLALATLIATGTVGCATARRPASHAHSAQRPTFALAVTVDGGLQPTPTQFAAIQARFVRELAAYGYLLVTDLSLADRILRVDFRPSPSDPDNAGHARIVSVRRNPLGTLAYVPGPTRYPTSFGYSGSFANASWPSLHSYAGNYYGYSESYYDGFSYSSPNLNPAARPTTKSNPRDNPLSPHRPGDRDDCPPDHYIRAVPGRFAGDSGAHPPSDHPLSAPSSPGRWGADRTYARSEIPSSPAGTHASWRGEGFFARSSTHSEATHPRSEPSYSPSPTSSSHSYSSSAVSAPSSFSAVSASDTVSSYPQSGGGSNSSSAESSSSNPPN